MGVLMRVCSSTYSTRWTSGHVWLREKERGWTQGNLSHTLRMWATLLCVRVCVCTVNWTAREWHAITDVSTCAKRVDGRSKALSIHIDLWICMSSMKTNERSIEFADFCSNAINRVLVCLYLSQNLLISILNGFLCVYSKNSIMPCDSNALAEWRCS